MFEIKMLMGLLFMSHVCFLCNLPFQVNQKSDVAFMYGVTWDRYARNEMKFM
jgi:hypothetical protein